MACDGLMRKAKNGKCRICLRVKKTDSDILKIVGEVRHGFALGHIWECVDIAGCDAAAQEKLNRLGPESRTGSSIAAAIKRGRFTTYTVSS